jgi:hypothetical protein
VPYQKDHESNEEEPGGSPTARLEATTIEEDNMKFGMLGAGTLSRAIAGHALLWRRTGTFAQEGKHVAALSHYPTKLRDAPPSLDNEGSAAR